MITFKEFKKKSDGTPVLCVTTPFHPDFAPKARLIGGRWESTNSRWQFAPRDADRVRELCITIYGEDDYPCERRDVRFDLALLPDGPELWGFGRCLAARRGRDYGVQLGEGVILLSGGFPGRGGSMNHPRVACGEAYVEIRDVPLVKVREAQERWGDQVTVIAPTTADVAEWMEREREEEGREDPDDGTPEWMERDRDTWREAAGMLEAVLSEICPRRARGIREIYSSLDWQLSPEEEAKDAARIAEEEAKTAGKMGVLAGINLREELL